MCSCVTRRRVIATDCAIPSRRLFGRIITREKTKEMVKGQRSRGSSAASNKGKKSTQANQTVHANAYQLQQQQQAQQTCVLVSQNATQIRNYAFPNQADDGVTAPQYSDQCLPLTASQGNFVLTDYTACQGATCGENKTGTIPPAFQLGGNTHPGLQYSTFPVSNPCVLESDTAHLWGVEYCAAATGDGNDIAQMVMGTGDPFLPGALSHLDADMLDILVPMVGGTDVMRGAGEEMVSEEMDVLNQLDLSVLDSFPPLLNDLCSIDPMALLPTMVPVQSSGPCISGAPMVMSAVSALPPGIVPPPMVTTSAHQGNQVDGDLSSLLTLAAAAPVCSIPQTPAAPNNAHLNQPVNRDIGDCLDLMKLMKPSCNSIPASATAPAKPLPPSSLPVQPQLTPPTPCSSVVMTPVTPGRPVSVSASSLLQCSFDTTDSKHMIQITDSAMGMQKSPTKFCAHFYDQLQKLAEKPCDLQVAYDRRAKLPAATMEKDTLVLSFPSDCRPMDQLCLDTRGKLLVIQEVVNTLAALHSADMDNRQYLWGCFSVWIGSRSVYIVPDFVELLQKQQEACSYQCEINPGNFDEEVVIQLVRQLVSTKAPHQLLSNTLEHKLRNIVQHSSPMTQVARVLGERRLCRLDAHIYGEEQSRVEVYCLEQEKLQNAFQSVKMFLSQKCPLWNAYWADNRSEVQTSEMAIPPDHKVRKMEFIIHPCNQLTARNALVIKRS